MARPETPGMLGPRRTRWGREPARHAVATIPETLPGGLERRSVADRLLPFAFGFVALHAVDAWLVQPVGGAGFRLLFLRLLALVALGGALAAAWHRFPGRAARGAIALAVGLCASVVGGAITLPRAAQGIDGNELTGLLSFVAGLFLVAVGLARLVRRRPWWRPVLTVVGVLLVLQFVLFPVVLAVYATNAPRPEPGPRAPVDVGLVAQDVAVRSADGTRLAAWYVPSTNGAAIVLLHGSGSTRDDLLDHAAMLASHGYGVLLLDSRGHGGSEGEPMESGWGGVPDVGAAVGYVLERPDVHDGRIGVLGLSMGGEQAISAAAVTSGSGAVVSEGAEVITVKDAAARPETVGGWPSIPMLWVEAITEDLLSDASPPAPLSESIAAIAPRPVLLIASGDVTEAASNRFYAEAGGPTVRAVGDGRRAPRRRAPHVPRRVRATGGRALRLRAARVVVPLRPGE